MSGHLWADHPYYCNEGNYFRVGLHTHFESWADFATEGGLLYDGDLDLNFLFRWDWRKPDPTLYLDGEDVPTEHVLELFFMIQRKGFNLSVEMPVTPDDEGAVRAWLEPRAEQMRSTWAPLLAGTR